MKMKMPPKIYRFIAKHWPLICGLIIGGMLGGIMQSISAFLLFGAIGWAYFHFDFFHVPDALVGGTPCELDGLRLDEPLTLDEIHIFENSGPGFYMNRGDAMAHGAMSSMEGNDNGPGFYI